MAAYAGTIRYALLDAGSAGGGHGRTLDWAALATLATPMGCWSSTTRMAILGEKATGFPSALSPAGSVGTSLREKKSDGQGRPQPKR